MQKFLLTTSLVAAGAEECRSIAPQVSDAWCNQNCNFDPPTCPPEYCQCGPAPMPKPTPPPSPPVPSPPPAPTPPAVLPKEILGYYSWNWGAGSTGPSGANMGCSFTGLIDVDQAIAQYSEGASWCCPALKGQKLLTLGGGNSAGLFTATTLAALTAKVDTVKAAGFAGVMYDVEEVSGPASTMAPLFAKSFAAYRNAGLIVAVTTSHSHPYQCDSGQDAVDIVNAWCADPNIDVISPQLYSTGREGEPELASTNSCKDAGCSWDVYANCKAEIAPSIVQPSHYAASKSFFETTVSRTTRGYYMWAQTKGEVAV